MVIQNTTQKKNAAQSGKAYCLLFKKTEKVSYLEQANKIYKACKEFEARYEQQEVTKTNYGHVKWVA